MWNEVYWERGAPHRDTRLAANYVLQENGCGRHIIRYNLLLHTFIFKLAMIIANLSTKGS